MMTLPDRAVIRDDESKKCHSSKIINLPLKRPSYDTIDGPPNNLQTTSDRSIPINEGIHSPEYPHKFSYRTFLYGEKFNRDTAPNIILKHVCEPGDEDNVNCFYCGGGVKNWESTDNAWIEHAKWYPECKFLEIMKDNHPLNDLGISKIVNMGFDSIFVQHVIADQVRRTGNNYSTYEQLLNAVLDLDPNREVTPPPFEEATPPTIFSVATPPTASLSTLSIEPLSRPALSSPSMSQSNITPNSESEENIQCKICMDNEANVCFLPCGHLVACGHCSMALDLCPICRCAVADRIRVFLS